MNIHSAHGIRVRSSVAVACVLAGLLLSTVSCSQGSDTPPPPAPAPTEPVTLPDLTDDRTPTNTDDYQSRFDTAFTTTAPAPAEDFTYEEFDGGVTVTGYLGGDVVVVIPDTIDQKPVVAVGSEAFAGKGTLKALSIPDTVLHIAPGALAGCNDLSTLRTPVYTADGTTYFGSIFGADTYEINAAKVPATLSTLILTRGEIIPDYAFYDCSFEAISLPATISEIGDFAFYGNDKLAYIPLLHTALLSIGDWAFTNNAALLSLDIPATVDSLGYAMLEGCGKLESLTLPFVGGARLADDTATDEDADRTADTTASTDADGNEIPAPSDVAYLGYLFGAAAYVHTAGFLPASLIRVTLLEGCGDIPANAFFECSSIREINLPAGVTAIGRRAFYRCERLSQMVLPDSVRTLGDDAFHGCTRLTTFTAGEGLTTLGVQVFMDCLSLRAVTLPQGVTHLSNAAFAGCRSLETLTAPGVVSRGNQVFRHCEKLQGWD